MNAKENRINQFGLSLDSTKATWQEIYKEMLSIIISEDVINELLLQGETTESYDLLNTRILEQHKIMFEALTSLIQEIEEGKREFI
jgi:hypothetical protein